VCVCVCVCVCITGAQTAGSVVKTPEDIMREKALASLGRGRGGGEGGRGGGGAGRGAGRGAAAGGAASVPPAGGGGDAQGAGNKRMRSDAFFGQTPAASAQVAGAGSAAPVAITSPEGAAAGGDGVGEGQEVKKRIVSLHKK